MLHATGAPQQAFIAMDGGDRENWRIRSSTIRTGCWVGPCVPVSCRECATVMAETVVECDGQALVDSGGR
jgi:hypothetical protein